MSIPPDQPPARSSQDWNWALEEHTRIGKLRIWLWPTDPGSTHHDPRGLDQVTVRAKPSNLDALSVQIGTQHVDILVGVPVDVSQPTIEVKQNNSIEIGLKMIGQENRTQVDHFDKMVRFGLTSLKKRGIGRLCCARCRNEVLDGLDQLNMKWFALPSEDWEEFVEYWVCHEDMKIKSGDDGSGGNGLRKPKNNEGFLGDWFLELDLDWIDQITPSDQNICRIIGWRSQTCNFTLGEVEQSHQGKNYEDTSNDRAEKPCYSRPNRRWIRFYKRAIISSNHQQSNHPHKGIPDDDDRAFETSLIQDEISKLIESNGFYKILIKNLADSRSIGVNMLWIFCQTVSICYKLGTNQDSPQRLQRSKLMYVFFDDDGSLEDRKKMERFENGSPTHAMASLKTPSGSDRRIGEMALPKDHFELLRLKLRSGSIYTLGLPAPALYRPGLPSNQRPLDQFLSAQDARDQDELFQGIYSVAYL
ncbi:hypothetical protein VP01_354g2 [Puccinia sorghi]|uniref:HECT domain-containing protein n=1 Tax=Puccinia sorghi TaxID=27349 RepID=A0A0L6UW96_9BASI|nr:hypothetical protein VP01_354g2 [Puccinia sorghi]